MKNIEIKIVLCRMTATNYCYVATHTLNSYFRKENSDRNETAIDHM